MTAPKFDRMAIAIGEQNHNFGDQLETVSHAEDFGFTTIVAYEARLTRDSISALGYLARATESINLMSAVQPIWTRNVGLMAQTWSSLYELAGPRLQCGLGGWWEPLASKVGIDRQNPNPLRAMWEQSTVLRRLFDLENVTYDGSYIDVRDIELDIKNTDYGPDRLDIPIYIGASGLKTNKMVGELVGKRVLDGCVLNTDLPVSYIEDCVDKLEEGVTKQGGSLEDVDRPQFVMVSMDEDKDKALDEIRGECTQYLGTRSYIQDAAAAHLDEGLIEAVSNELGDWPITDEDIERASELVPDEYLTTVAACGTPEEVVNRVKEYCDAGCTEPILYIQSDNATEVMGVFGEHLE